MLRHIMSYIDEKSFMIKEIEFIMRCLFNSEYNFLENPIRLSSMEISIGRSEAFCFGKLVI